MKSVEFLKIEGILKGSFGLNKYKAEMMTFLLINGECKISELGVEVPRSRRYDILDVLEIEGFIKIVRKTKGLKKTHKDYVKKSRFIPFDIQEIVDNRKRIEKSELSKRFEIMDGSVKQIEEQLGGEDE